MPVLPDPSKVVSHDDRTVRWRRFSAREAARLQGFPEGFVLCEERAHHMLGNAVAPSVVCIIAAPLVQSLGWSSVGTEAGAGR